MLTHWGRGTHVCVSKLSIVGSDNGLSPGRRQAIIWTNAGILLIGPLGNKLQWNLNRNSNIFIQENACENVVCEMASILSRPQCVSCSVVWFGICQDRVNFPICPLFFVLWQHDAWWRHQMETFSALLAICAGNSPVPGEFPAQRPVTRSFDVFFDLHRINGCVNNGETGDLRRYRAHCDVTVMGPNNSDTGLLS